MPSLLQAIQQVNIPAIIELIEDGIDLNAPCSNEELPLKIAIMQVIGGKSEDPQGLLVIIDLLLSNGADPHKIIMGDMQESLLAYLTQEAGSKSLRRLDKMLGFLSENSKAKREHANIIIEKLLACKHYSIDINARDKQGRTLLLTALFNGNTKLAKLFLAAGADPAISDNYGYTAFHAACSTGNIAVIETLVARNVDIHAIDNRGFTALDQADDPDLLLFLLKKGLKGKQHDLLSLFRLAQSKHHLKLLDYLFEQGLASYVDERGNTALLSAHSDEMRERLLKCGALDAVDQEKNSPLFECLYLYVDDEEELRRQFMLFCQYGARIDVKDSEGNTLLHCAIQAPSIFQMLMKAGLSINAVNYHQKTVLHLAAECGDFNRLHDLFEWGADPALVDNAGKRALECLNYLHVQSRIHLAPAVLCQAVLERLIKSCPIESVPCNAQDLMLIAVQCDYLSLVERLFEQGVSLVEKNRNHSSAFEVAAYQQKYTMLDWMLKKMIPISAHTLLLTGVLTQLLHRYDHRGIALLLEAGADINSINAQGQTLLSYFVHSLVYASLPLSNFSDEATFHEAIDKTLELLFKYPVDVNKKNKQGQTLLEELLHPFAQTDFFSWIRFLLNQGADLPQDKDSLTTLAKLAAKHQNKKVLQFVIEKALPLHFQADILTSMALFAIKTVDIVLLDQLLSWGLKINEPLADQVTSGHHRYLLDEVISPMHQITGVRSTSDTEKLLSYFITRGAVLHYPLADHYRLMDNKGSLLHFAAEQGWVNVIELLLQPGTGFHVDIQKATTPEKETALQIAVNHSQLDVAKLLVAKNANVHVQNRKNESLLHVACQKGDVPMVQWLLSTSIDKNADCHASNWLFSVEKKAIHVAAEYKDKAIAQILVNLLFAQGVIVDSQLLMTVICQNFDEAMLRYVISELAKTSYLEANFLGSKILHYVVKTNHILACQLLLEKCPKLLEVRDFSGCTPLHYAVKPGHEAIFHYLLEKGANLHAMNYEGYDIAAYAFFYGNSQVLKLSWPLMCDRVEFRKLRAGLIENKEFASADVGNLFLLSQYCYKLLILLGSAKLALAFIEKYKNNTSLQPIHDLCLFQLPMDFSWNQQAWANLAVQYGIELTQFLHWAPRIEHLLQRAPINLDEIKTIAKQITYYRESENPMLAALFIKYKISEQGFNRVLNHFHPKQADNIPDLLIEGRKFGEPRFYLKKLPAHDLRGFVLGALTHCCQSVGSAGESCAMHGMQSPYGGFYAVFRRPPEKILKKRWQIVALAEEAETIEEFIGKQKEKAQKEKYRKMAASVQNSLPLLCEKLQYDYKAFEEGEMVAQLWAWLSQNHALILDSWERLRPKDDRLCQPFLERLGTLILKKTSIARVLLGRGGQTPKLSYRLVKTTEQPKDYYDYRDSHEQYLIASRDKEDILSIQRAVEAAEKTVNSSYVADYQAEEMYLLLSYYFARQGNVMVLSPIDLTMDNCQTKMVDELSRFKANQMLSPEKPCRSILTLRTKEKYWTALIIECGSNQRFHQVRQYQVMTYLDFSGNAIPNTLHQALQSNFKQHVSIQTCSLIYNENVMLSGAWLLETLRRYAEKAVLLTYPIDNIYAVIMAQERLLKNITMKNASNNWGLFKTKENAYDVFRFFAPQDSAAIKCVSQDFNALQTEIDREQVRGQRFLFV